MHSVYVYKMEMAVSCSSGVHRHVTIRHLVVNGEAMGDEANNFNDIWYQTSHDNNPGLLKYGKLGDKHEMID